MRVANGRAALKRRRLKALENLLAGPKVKNVRGVRTEEQRQAEIEVLQERTKV